MYVFWFIVIVIAIDIFQILMLFLVIGIAHKNSSSMTVNITYLLFSCEWKYPNQTLSYLLDSFQILSYLSSNSSTKYVQLFVPKLNEFSLHISKEKIGRENSGDSHGSTCRIVVLKQMSSSVTKQKSTFHIALSKTGQDFCLLVCTGELERNFRGLALITKLRA